MQRTSEPNHVPCAGARRKLACSAGQDIYRHVLGSFFEIARDAPLESIPVTDSGDGNDSDDDDVSAGDYLGVDDLWVQVREESYLRMEEQLDSTLELVLLCLTEPISLGFLPYQTEMTLIQGNGNGSASTVTAGIDGNRSNNRNVTELRSEQTEINQDDHAAGEGVQREGEGEEAT